MKLYIDQYNSLNFKQDNNHHNQATYHLKIMLPAKKQYYALEIPEIYSASNIYINQELMWSSGQIEEYRPQIHTVKLCFLLMIRLI